MGEYMYTCLNKHRKDREGKTATPDVDDLKGMTALEGRGDFLATVNIYFAIFKN